MPVQKCLLAVFYFGVCCATNKTVRGVSSGIPEGFGKVFMRFWILLKN